MKYIFIFVLKGYQMIISPNLSSLLGVKSACRFSPTCSQYAIEKIEKQGVIKGMWLSSIRLLSCQPYIQFKVQSAKLKVKELSINKIPLF